MICIYCFHMKTRVTNSRTHKKQPQTWRRRQCVNCKGIFTSYERPDSSDLIINSKGKKSSFNIGKLILSIARASQHNKHQAEYDSFQLASTIEISLISKSKKTRSGSSMIISRAEIINTTYQTLRRYDELTGMQYAMQHGLITSVRRRGRPSTIATSDESGAAPD
jgi:transcriptional repressor NrdR